MRLLNTSTYQFETFFDSDIPSYAILSHRWGEDEVDLKEMKKWADWSGLSLRSILNKLLLLGDGSDAEISRPGLLKILEFCGLCRERSFDWGWVDTCCIDKESSAELSKAINSMYKWYEYANICFVYLADVYDTRYEGVRFRMPEAIFENHLPEDAEIPEKVTSGSKSILNETPQAFMPKQEEHTDRWDRIRSAVKCSDWFTRGWTLQELLAPQKVEFYDRLWAGLGDRTALATTISAVTGISVDQLDYTVAFEYSGIACVAQKMSWVARRATSRGEDIAYCMFGLFDVNLPLLYGEGRAKAFQRLQMEILRTCDDESIFAWWTSPAHDEQAFPPPPCSQMLAPDSTFFAASGGIMSYNNAVTARKPFTLASKGIEVTAPVRHMLEVSTKYAVESELSALNKRLRHTDQEGKYRCLVLYLGCDHPHDRYNVVPIILEQQYDGLYERVHSSHLLSFMQPPRPITLAQLAVYLNEECLTVRVRNRSLSNSVTRLMCPSISPGDTMTISNSE